MLDIKIFEAALKTSRKEMRKIAVIMIKIVAIFMPKFLEKDLQPFLMTLFREVNIIKLISNF